MNNITVAQKALGTDQVPAGIYEAILDKLEIKGNKRLIYTFHITGPTHTGLEVMGQSSLKISPRAKLFTWYTQLHGSPPVPDTAVDLADLIGKPCRVKCAPKTSNPLIMEVEQIASPN